MPFCGTGYRAVSAALMLLLCLGTALPATAGGEIVVRPELVRISSLFSGVRMSIRGDLPADCQAVLTVRGKRIEEEMMRKSLHWDLWMNSGEVDIENTPLLYMASSSDPALLSPDAGNFPWGYAELERKAEFKGRIKPVEDDTIFREFVQLKERDQLYRLYPGGLEITHAGPDLWRAHAEFHLPSRLKPGTYYVTMWIVRNGAIIEKRSASFNVELEGLPAVLHAMAQHHGILYGLLAVVLAGAVGMLTGLIFHRKGDGH